MLVLDGVGLELEPELVEEPLLFDELSLDEELELEEPADFPAAARESVR